MKPETLAAFDRLERADWFSALGQPREGPFVIVSSWEEALEQCGSDQWQDLILEAANRYSEAVARKDAERFRLWNMVAVEVRSVALPLVERTLRSVGAVNGLPKALEDAVRWDMIHFGLECEFSDVFPPGFFASQAYWYLNGRFPCGWRGDFPEGKLVLY